MRYFLRRIRRFALHVQHDAQLSAEVNIARQKAFRLIHRKTSDRNLFADDRNLTFQIFLYVRRSVDFAREQRRRIRRILLYDYLRDLRRDFPETRVLRHEVRFTVDFEQYARIAVDIARNNSFRRNTRRLLFRFRDSALSQKLRRLRHVSVGIGERFLTIHYARARSLAQRHYVLCCKCHFLYSS